MDAGRCLLVTALGSALLLTSCQSGAGPVEMGGDPGSLCVKARPGQSFLLGEVVRSADEAVRVQALELTDPEGVEVTASYVVPVEGDAIGSSVDPPQDFPLWATRTQAVGAELAPGQDYNVIVVVRRTSQEAASATAMTLTYVADGHEHSASGTTRYELEDSCT